MIFTNQYPIEGTDAFWTAYAGVDDFLSSHAGRTCYARAHHSGWVLVVRQIVAQREPPVMLRVWGRLERVPDNDANCLALWERCAYAR